MFEWLKKQKENIKALSFFLGIFVPLISVVVSGIQYIEANKRLTKQKSFENYHIVVSRISGGDKSDLYVSTANVYELRNYPEYYEVSLRILEDLQKNWTLGHDDALKKEIISTKNFLESLK